MWCILNLKPRHTSNQLRDLNKIKTLNVLSDKKCKIQVAQFDLLQQHKNNTIQIMKIKESIVYVVEK